MRRARPALLAILTWLVGLVIAGWVPRRLDLDPFTIEGQAMPVAYGLVAGAIVLGLWVWLRRDEVLGLAAGVVSWSVALGLQQILLGTPYSPGGLGGDVGRFTALATRYMVATASSDAIIKGAPSEYPPLVPWLIGKTAVLLDVPAWQLLGWAATVLTSASVVLAFWLWSRVTSAAVALVLASLPLAVFSDPSKSFHLFTLQLLAPWVLVAFAGLSRRRGGLHWLWSGLLGALIVLVYPGYLVFASLGIAVVVVLAWRRSTHRRQYVLHLVGVAAVTAVGVSWYVVPFVVGQLSFHTGSVSDQFDSLSNFYDPAHLPPTVLTGSGVLLSFWLLGALSLAWYGSRRQVWATTLAAIALGAFAYRTWRLVIYAGSGQTGFLQYADRLIDVVLVGAAALGVAAAVPTLGRRLGVQVPVAVPVLLVALSCALGVLTYQSDNRLPVGSAPGSLSSLQAQIEPLPDCTLPRFSPIPTGPGATAPVADPRSATLSFTPIPCFPATAIREAVERVYGQGALPVAVSYSEKLWAFYPWYGFLSDDRTSAGLYQDFDRRESILRGLAGLPTPAGLSTAMADTEFGPIDVMVLRPVGAGKLAWNASGEPAVIFDRSQFLGPEFTTVDIDENTVVVIRTGAQVDHASYPR